MTPDKSPHARQSREHHLLHLLQAIRCTRDARDRAELNTLLRDDPAARATMARLLVDEQALISCLRDDHIVALLEPVPAPESPLHKAPSWLSRRSLTTAAAGVVLGMLCTSMLFAYVAPSLRKVTPLIQESFESGTALWTTGVPPEPEQWSGEYSESVPEHSGVKPAHGTRMIRVLRSDYEGRDVPRPSRQGDLMRVIDVRPFQRGATGGEAVITLSAMFNAAPFPSGEHYHGMVTLYALGAGTDLHGATEDRIREEALAFSLGAFPSLDRNPATWQQASTRLLLPPGTERVMLKVSFRRVPAEGESLSALPDSVAFPAHFVDDVRAFIRIGERPSDRTNPANRTSP
jgi:hypothetical protein